MVMMIYLKKVFQARNQIFKSLSGNSQNHSLQEIEKSVQFLKIIEFNEYVFVILDVIFVILIDKTANLAPFRLS